MNKPPENLPEKIKLGDLICWTCCIDLANTNLRECIKKWTPLGKDICPEMMIFEILIHSDGFLSPSCLENAMNDPDSIKPPFSKRIHKESFTDKEYFADEDLERLLEAKIVTEDNQDKNYVCCGRLNDNRFPRILKKASWYSGYFNRIDESLSKSIDIQSIIIKARAWTFHKILPEYLAVIMAYENNLLEDLNKLLRIFIDEKEDDFRQKISAFDAESRITLWYHIFYKWMGYDGLRIDVDEISKENQLKPADPNGYEYIPLLGFRNYIKKINNSCDVNIQLPESLFPEEAKSETPNRQDTIQGEEELITQSGICFSNDFSSVRFPSGESALFTTKQSHAIEILWNASQGNHPDVREQKVLNEIDSSSSRLRDIFKPNDLKTFEALIESKRQGFIRLK